MSLIVPVDAHMSRSWPKSKRCAEGGGAESQISTCRVPCSLGSPTRGRTPRFGAAQGQWARTIGPTRYMIPVMTRIGIRCKRHRGQETKHDRIGGGIKMRMLATGSRQVLNFFIDSATATINCVSWLLRARWLRQGIYHTQCVSDHFYAMAHRNAYLMLGALRYTSYHHY